MTRVRAWLTIAAGLVLAAAGGGMGVPHLAKEGWSLTAVVALTVMAAGLVLAAFGTVAVVRAARGIWRVVALVAVVAAAWLLVPTIAVAVAATHVPHTDLGDGTPADLGLAYRDVAFRTPDDVRLSGWYVPSRNGDAVVLLHGAGSTRDDVLEQAEVLAELGYGVLLYDARGHGRSGGRAMELGWNGDADLAGAVRFVRAQPDAATGRVHAVGMSMGGEEAVGALPAIPELCAVVAEGATARTAADKAWLSDVYGFRGLVQEGRDRLMYGLIDVLASAPAPRTLRHAVEEATPRRVLLIAAGREPDEGHAARHIAEGSPRSVTVWVAPGAGHTGVLEARRSEWIQRVGEFLATAPC